MLLTFLGLTMAATTSTELQIATNYRWSQQALYNAEAGLEAGKLILTRTADAGTQWGKELPTVRSSPAQWNAGSAPGPVDTTLGRDFERSDCDTRGGVGYGKVLVEGTTRYENVSSFATETLNGAFTLWVRRGLTVDNAGMYADENRNDVLTIVSEGVAPYVAPADAFIRAHQATRILEVRLTLGISPPTDPCLGGYAGQEGGSPFGENFYGACAGIKAGATGSLGQELGGAGAGALTSTGVK
jgi:hypothetical protein